MAGLKKRCVVKRTIRVVCPDDCNTKSKSCSLKKKGKKKKCLGLKKKLRKRPIRVTRPNINVQTPAPTVNVSTPPAEVNVQTNPPAVHVTTPPPVVNIETPKPDVHVNIETPKPDVHVNIETPKPDVHVNIETPKPDVHVNVESAKPEVKVNIDYPEDECLEELREQLREYRGEEIQVLFAGGAGSGGEPPNRIGILESVGKGTFTLRPTTANDMGQVVIYSICQIVGFRPSIAVSTP
ncbi:hypothetical protein [Paenibacillus sedimenti]|uniref:Uncharacterized protein n=1 Tax=Paenibacillus sedimenti TaxID=2770274 RepID=A0A926QKL2_9BACL|nr:hypothetical protein [Paenibacillus sedimenti]MBD0381597.1 hypothetical protein [Paenibacillus sedimenti]